MNKGNNYLCYGHGYNDRKYKSFVDMERLKESYVWGDMLRRCYSEKYHIKYPTYIGCTVSNNFKLYTYFYEWCQNQIGFKNEGWHLDKDILIKGNKLYSENNCCFVPSEINNLFLKSYTIRGKYPIGVTYDKTTNKFISQVKNNNLSLKNSYLGRYDNPTDAFNIYKKHKEEYIKEVADKYKGLIDGRVYEAMYNYQIEITD